MEATGKKETWFQYEKYNSVSSHLRGKWLCTKAWTDFLVGPKVCRASSLSLHSFPFVFLPTWSPAKHLFCLTCRSCKHWVDGVEKKKNCGGCSGCSAQRGFYLHDVAIQIKNNLTGTCCAGVIPECSCDEFYFPWICSLCQINNKCIIYST